MFGPRVSVERCLDILADMELWGHDDGGVYCGKCTPPGLVGWVQATPEHIMAHLTEEIE